MKKLLFISLLLFVSFTLQSQSLKKNFFTILDEYIAREPNRKGFDKDSILLSVSIFKFDEIENDFLIGISMYMFHDYPIKDSLKTYKGIKMVVKYPEEMKKELSKSFKSIKDTRKKEEEEFARRPESVCNYSFQVNQNNEIYFIITSKFEDKYYYKKLKKKGLKFSKDLKFTKDMYKKQN